MTEITGQEVDTLLALRGRMKKESYKKGTKMSKTLADYTPDERRKMIGMWCDCEDIYAPCVLADIDGRDAVLLAEDFNGRPVLDPYDIRHVVPRFDLPRAWAPSGEPVPGEWEERTDQDGIGDRIWFTRQRRYITDWEMTP